MRVPLVLAGSAMMATSVACCCGSPFAPFERMWMATLETQERMVGELGPGTCTVVSVPPAEVWEEDVFGRRSLLGPTPLEVERPMGHSERVFVVANGYREQEAWLLTRDVKNPCAVAVVLDPLMP